MYTISADDTVLFQSFDRALSKQVYLLYKRLYRWATVKATFS